jgi:hypothetical protein
MKKKILLVITMLLMLMSCRVDFANSSDTTKMPSWVPNSDIGDYGYSECSSDVRLVVTPKPLVSGDVQALISGGYSFMTVVRFENMFYWYFVKHSCMGDVWFWENDGYYDVPDDFLYKGGVQ